MIRRVSIRVAAELFVLLHTFWFGVEGSMQVPPHQDHFTGVAEAGNEVVRKWGTKSIQIVKAGNNNTDVVRPTTVLWIYSYDDLVNALSDPGSDVDRLYDAVFHPTRHANIRWRDRERFLTIFLTVGEIFSDKFKLKLKGFQIFT